MSVEPAPMGRSNWRWSSHRAKIVRVVMDDSEPDRLHLAASMNDPLEVERLITDGHLVDRFDDLGKTALHYAAEREALQVVRLLLDAGAHVDAQDVTEAGNTALGQVAGYCSLELAKLLVNAGADPAIKGWMQLSALDRAQNRKRGDGPGVLALLRQAAGQ